MATATLLGWGNYYWVSGPPGDYDYLNRMIYAANGTDHASYWYDGDGNVSLRQIDGGNMEFEVVDDENPSGYPQVLEEFTSSGSSGALERVYNYGLALVSQQQFNATNLLPTVLSYYGYDGHGSVRFLLNTNGNVTDTYTYDAFGNLINQWYSGSGPTTNDFLYCGLQYDWLSGLYNNRARRLFAPLGTFTTMDGDYGNNEDPLSLHKYLYAEDDPVNGIDPSGHDMTDIEFFLSDPGYLVSMSLPEIWRLLETPFGNQHGFKYELVASKDTKGGASMSTGAIVEDAAGVNGFKNDAANFGKSKGKRILRLELFGHGDPNATVGTAGYAQLALGDKIQSPFNNELMGGDFEQLFNGRFWPDAEIDLEFCHSLDVPQIPQLFKNLAPNAQIWGVHGEQNGIGEYGPIENLVKY
ncbi:MAG TPA: RHS repeat-associated core domain-containing protein [Verrucomicrobiae bacterium]|nr:RHS repeat-associated core domain-containing protein [Verrucomicrobiae bacterium]